jgi:hypothetical protein
MREVHDSQISDRLLEVIKRLPYYLKRQNLTIEMLSGILAYQNAAFRAPLLFYCFFRKPLFEDLLFSGSQRRDMFSRPISFNRRAPLAKPRR